MNNKFIIGLTQLLVSKVGKTVLHSLLCHMYDQSIAVCTANVLYVQQMYCHTYSTSDSHFWFFGHSIPSTSTMMIIAMPDYLSYCPLGVMHAKFCMADLCGVVPAQVTMMTSQIAINLLPYK
jgi:hypothetical protein